jgi:hypothetical protein
MGTGQYGHAAAPQHAVELAQRTASILKVMHDQDSIREVKFPVAEWQAVSICADEAYRRRLPSCVTKHLGGSVNSPDCSSGKFPKRNGSASSPAAHVEHRRTGVDLRYGCQPSRYLLGT